MTLREKLIVLRDKAGISQMSLAHQLDVSRQAVSRWESGDTTPSMDKLKALAKIYGVSLDWLCSDSDMADEKPIEVVSPLEENETKNTTVSAKDKRKRKIRFVAIALVVGVITLTCIWIATRSENKEMPGKQFAGTVNAAERAMGKFDVTVKAGELKPAKTGFPMAAGETVTINATYSPSSADVDFGLVDKNGRFHYLKGENGAFNEKIEIPQNGTYTFAIRNNSDVDIEVTGYVNY